MTCHLTKVAATFAELLPLRCFCMPHVVRRMLTDSCSDKRHFRICLTAWIYPYDKDGILRSFSFGQFKRITVVSFFPIIGEAVEILPVELGLKWDFLHFNTCYGVNLRIYNFQLDWQDLGILYPQMYCKNPCFTEIYSLNPKSLRIKYTRELFEVTVLFYSSMAVFIFPAAPAWAWFVPFWLLTNRCFSMSGFLHKVDIVGRGYLETEFCTAVITSHSKVAF